MAKIKGKNADFAIGTVGVTTNPPFTYADANMTRVETLSNEITLNIETTTVDTSAYGDDFDQFEVMVYRWTVDINAYVDDGATNTESIFVNGLLGLVKYPFVFSPNGKPAGEASATQPRYSGRVVISSVAVNPVRASVSNLRIRLQGDGQLHRATA